MIAWIAFLAFACDSMALYYRDELIHSEFVSWQVRGKDHGGARSNEIETIGMRIDMFRENVRKVSLLLLWSALLLLAGCVSGGGEQTATVSVTQVVVEVYDAGGNPVSSVTAGAALTAKATIKDTAGAAQSGVLVTFAVSGSDLSLITTTALTNATGVATVALTSASKTVGGVVSVTASASISGKTVDNSSSPKLVSVTTAAALPSISVEVYDAGGNAAVTVAGSANLTAKAIVRDASGIAQSGVLVTFATSSPDLTFGTTTAVTDSTGMASVALTTASRTAGGAASVTASATVKGTSIDNVSSPKLLTVTKATSLPTVVVEIYDASGNPASSATGATTLTARATVRDAAGAVQGGILVAFASSSTDLAFKTTTAVTDNATGVASVSLTTASVTAGGAASITASATVKGTAIDNSGAPRLLTVVKSSPAITLSIKDASGNATASATTSSNVSVSATVIDAAGTLQKNVPVTFSTDSSYLVFIPSSGTGSTGSSGTASIAMTAAAATTGGATQVTAQARLPDGTTVTATPVTILVTGAPANVTPTPSLRLSLLNTSGAEATSLTVGASLTVRILLKDGSNNPMPNTVVSLSSGDTGLAVVSQSSVLTGNDGVALARLDAASASAVGANYLNATATVSGKPVTASAPFSVGAATVSLSLAVSQSSISAYGTTSVSATVSVNGLAPPAPMTVQFTSSCASSGKASLPAGVQTVNGVATATYTDKGCGATDTIVASVNSAQSSASLVVARPQAANIQFVGVTPATGLLVLKGTGGAGYYETATVKFKVVDTASNGIANQSVIFGLTTRQNGILLDNTASGSLTKQTDSSGEVSVTVQSGTAPTAVWVTATLGNLVTQSNKLVISTGRPAQKFFSLSVDPANIEGGDYDGAKAKLTVRASDRLGNLVPDGTTINFITEGGQIVSSDGSSSTCSIVSGACSVNLVSAAYRPVGDSEPSGQVTKNRVTVVAYTLGEENFVDANGNNLYESGEAYDDLGDVYIDSNENGQWDAGEQSISFSASNTKPCVEASQKPNTCSGSWGQGHVRKSAVITFSGSSPSSVSTTTLTMLTTKGATNVANCTKSFPVILTDAFKNPLPAATALTIADNGVQYKVNYEAQFSDSTKSASTTTGVATVTVSPAAIESTNAAGGTTHSLTVQLPSSLCPATPLNYTLATGVTLTSSDATPSISGSFNLKVTTPAGTATLMPFKVSGP